MELLSHHRVSCLQYDMVTWMVTWIQYRTLTSSEIIDPCALTNTALLSWTIGRVTLTSSLWVISGSWHGHNNLPLVQYERYQETSTVLVQVSDDTNDDTRSAEESGPEDDPMGSKDDNSEDESEEVEERSSDCTSDGSYDSLDM